MNTLKVIVYTFIFFILLGRFVADCLITYDQSFIIALILAIFKDDSDNKK